MFLTLARRLASAVALSGVFLAGNAAAVDLVMNNADATDPVPAGGNIVYQLRVTNNAPATTATGVTTTHSIPATTRYQSFTGTGVNCTGMTPGQVGPGTLTCTLPDLVTDAEAPYTVTLGTTVAGLVEFGATTAAIETDTQLGNNTDDEETTITDGADLSIVVTPATGNAAAGAQYSFVLTVSNAGPAAATNVQVQNPLPAGFSVTTLPSGCGNVSGTLRCNVDGAIAVGGSAVITLNGQIAASSGTTINNTASVLVTSSSAPQDPISGNNASTASVTVTASGSDVAITKTRSVGGLSLAVGTSFNFILTPSYTGEVPTTLVVSDTIPSNYTLGAVAASQNGWSCGVAGQTVTCSRASGSIVGAGVPLGVITIPVAVTTPGASITNTATISSASPADPDLDNNTARDVAVTLSEPGVSLGIVKSGPTQAVVGVPYNYNITVTNRGDAAFVGVLRMTDALPAGLTINSFTLNGWTCPATPIVGPASVECTLGTIGSQVSIAAGAKAPVLSLNVTAANIGSVTNRGTVVAEVCNLAQCGGGTSESTQTVVAAGSSADLAVTQSGSVNSVPVGQPLTYTASVENLGPVVANGVILTATLPLDVSFVSATPSSGSCSLTPGVNATTTAGNRTVSCNVGTLSSGVERSVAIVIRPNASTANTTITQSVSASATTPDDLPANNSASTDTFVEAAQLDLVVNKTESVDPVALGDDTVYTLTVNNTGPTSANAVVLTDTLPAAGLAYRSLVTSQGSCTPPAVDSVGGTLTCSLGNLVAGATAAVNVTMRAVQKGVHLNRVTVVSDETGSGAEIADNNTREEATTVRTKADPEVVSKTPSANPVGLAEAFNFVIRVRNNTGAGLGEADDVVVSDNLPDGMVLSAAPTVAPVSGTTSLASCTGAANGVAFSCNLGTVSSAAVVDITVPVRVIATTTTPQVFSNTATVATSSLDVDLTNNSATGQVTVNGSSLAGRVFRDVGNDGAVNPGDSGIAGVTITLTGTDINDVPVNRSATTDADGNFVFANLPQGTYSIVQGAVDDPTLADGIDTAGTAGGTVGDDRIDAIVLPDDTAATGYLFAEVPGADQRIGIAKVVTSATQTAATTFRAAFELVVANPTASVTATFVQVEDDLAAAFPTASTRTIPSAPVVTACSGTQLVANAGYNGVTDTALLDGLQNLQAGERCTIRFAVDLGFASVPTTTQFNTAIATSRSTPGGNVLARDESDDGVDPDPDGDGDPTGDGENDPTPVDLVTGTLVLTKTTPLANVSVGQQVPYTVTALNPGTVGLTRVEIRDLLPPGFKFVAGSASLDGVAVTPSLDGRTLTVGPLDFAPGVLRTLRLLTVVGAGVAPGEYVNSAQAFSNLTDPVSPVSNLATATVRVVPDATFDCADLIGKVFDDANANGYQDDGEAGLPNVRVVTARGWLVTTDADGRYHVACAAIPDADRGSNFIMKLDERSLPTGYRVTTENPRDVRLTRGKLAKLNFGATIHKVIRLDLTDAAFEPGSKQLKPDWVAPFASLPERLKARPSVLRLGYTVGADGEALAKARLHSLRTQLQAGWKRGCCHTLLIEDEIFRPASSVGGK